MGNFIPPAIPDFESSRLEELYALNILDSGKEERFDRFTKLVSEIFQVPIAVVSLVDSNRQWFKSCVGLPVDNTSREVSFCGHALFEKEILIVNNASQDKRFAENPLVIGDPNIRFYAGAVLHGPTGQPLGTLCIIDKEPRELSQQQQDQLIQFAHLIEHELVYNYYLDEVRRAVEKSLYFDSLTGLPNKRLLNERLAQAIQSGSSDQIIAVIALRINRIKDLENTFSHQASEAIIHEMAVRLRKIFEKDNTIAKLDEDTFLIFLMNIKSNLIVQQLNKFIDVVKIPFHFKNEKHTITCNIGVSLYPFDAKNEKNLISHAVYALRSQPTENKSIYRFYSDDETKRLSREYEIETRLLKAIDNGALELLYQPTFDSYSGHVCGIEISSQWVDSNIGLISYEELYGIAKQSNLIIPLSKWMLNKACHQNFIWQKKLLGQFPIRLKMTDDQLQDENFINHIELILQETKLSPQWLNFEIEESSFSECSLKHIRQLNELGIEFSIHPTRFYTLSLIKNLPIKTIKIDSSLISEMDNQHGLDMVHALIAMSKTFGLISFADGVESKNQLVYLRAYQCDQVQGKLFSLPKNADVLDNLLMSDEKIVF